MISGRGLLNMGLNEDEVDQSSIRPESLDEFIGQHLLKKNLSIFIGAAKSRNEALDHVLFYGPPGLGKTTLSKIIAKELGAEMRSTAAPMLSKTGDLAAILTNLQQGDVLFIDEIHRLSPAIEEILYSAMEDFSIDIIIGDGPAARTVKIDIPKFTLVGATTRLGMLSNPLRDRFGIPMKLDFYSRDELAAVINRSSRILNVSLTDNASAVLANCSRGTPRIALRLLRRIRDFANYNSTDMVDEDLVGTALNALKIDSLGLDRLDYLYLNFISSNFDGGPVGIETIAAGLSEDRDTIEDTIEPYLMQIGFVARTARGRVLTQNCINYLIENDTSL
jgi:Holliday junction DNA helicase RuvB